MAQQLRATAATQQDPSQPKFTDLPMNPCQPPSRRGQSAFANASSTETEPVRQPGRPEATLLGLPAELRNQIWELLLIAENAIVHIQKPHQHPALLSTCRQIRHEGRGIYLHSNIFMIDVIDCDSSLFQKFDQYVFYERQQIWLELVTGGRPNWANLKKWCLAVWNGDLPAYVGDERPQDKLRRVVWTALQIAGECNIDASSWLHCEILLKQVRYLAAVVDTRWLDGVDPVWPHGQLLEEDEKKQDSRIDSIEPGHAEKKEVKSGEDNAEASSTVRKVDKTALDHTKTKEVESAKGNGEGESKNATVLDPDERHAIRYSSYCEAVRRLPGFEGA